MKRINFLAKKSYVLVHLPCLIKHIHIVLDYFGTRDFPLMPTKIQKHQHSLCKGVTPIRLEDLSAPHSSNNPLFKREVFYSKTGKAGEALRTHCCVYQQKFSSQQQRHSINNRFKVALNLVHKDCPHHYTTCASLNV